MIDTIKSVEIYNHFINGRMINKEQMSAHGEFEPDPLFAELMDNRAEYQKQYEMSGFKLIDTGDFAYIVKAYEYEPNKTLIAMKAYCLLLILGKATTSNARRLDRLSSAAGGLTQAELNKVEDMPNTKEILKRTDMGTDLYRSIKNILIERNIMYIHPVTQNLVLASAGVRFFTDITDNFDLDDDLGLDETTTPQRKTNEIVLI